MRHPLPCLALSVLVLLTSSLAASAQGPKFIFDTGETEWRGERIELPPKFAADMEWIGEEDIRFAPGMFQAAADDFFSYVLVFLLESEADTSAEAIEREVLTYYRGLGEAVMKGKQLEVDASTFTLALEKSDTVTSPPAGIDAASTTAYTGTLDWIEPFATQQKQTLHLEVHLWKHGEQSALFLCVTPKTRDQEIWTTLRNIRAAFKIED